MIELLRDVDGGTFHAAHFAGVLDTLWDDRLGELTRVRMQNGSVRTIVSSELKCLEGYLTEVGTRDLRNNSSSG